MICPTRENVDHNPPYELILVIFLTLLLFAQLSFAPLQESVDAQGYATVTVLNSDPEILSIDIFSNNSPIQSIGPDRIYEYRMGIGDHNTMTDIDSVVVELWFSEKAYFDESGNITCDYRFEYIEKKTIDTELNGTFSQTFPMNCSELAVGECSVTAGIMDYSGYWSFAIRLNKSDSKSNMFVRTTVTDSGGLEDTAVSGPYPFQRSEGIFKPVEKGAETVPMNGEPDSGIYGLPMITKVIICIAAIGAACMILTRRGRRHSFDG